MISKNPIEIIVPNKLKVFKYIGDHKGEGVVSTDIMGVFPSLKKVYAHHILEDLESIGLIHSWKENHKGRKKIKVDLTLEGSDAYDKLFNGKIEDLFDHGEDKNEEQTDL